LKFSEAFRKASKVRKQGPKQDYKLIIAEYYPAAPLPFENAYSYKPRLLKNETVRVLRSYQPMKMQ
jgi:hypothetical protein